MDETHAHVTIELAGESMQLRGEGALYWPARQTVLLADPHFGKGACFRQAGIPVPRGTGEGTLNRLDVLIRRTGAERLCVLGDLFHAAASRTSPALEALAEWRAAHDQLAVELIPGNHDAHAGRPAAALHITEREAVTHEPPFVLRHDPADDPRGHVLAGHVHPAVRLSDAGVSFRLPCFHVSEHATVLPAFGEFTGMHVVRAARGDRLYPLVEGHVVSPRTQRAGQADQAAPATGPA